MSDDRIKSPGSARPWIALLIPPLAWTAFEYGLGSSLRPACGAVGDWLGPVWGAISLLACAIAAGLAWPLAGSARTGATRPWLARIALLAAGIYALAIAFQTAATLIVPSCAR